MAFHILSELARDRAPVLASLLSATIAVTMAAAIAHADTPKFTYAIDDSPLPITLLPGEQITPGVQKFYDTGEDPYKGDAAALTEGKTL